MKRYIWLAVMSVWLVALVTGAVWVWPEIRSWEDPAAAISALSWLVMGGIFWYFAFRLGLTRYWDGE